MMETIGGLLLSLITNIYYFCVLSYYMYLQHYQLVQIVNSKKLLETQDIILVLFKSIGAFFFKPFAIYFILEF